MARNVARMGWAPMMSRMVSSMNNLLAASRLARLAARGAELSEHAIQQVGRRRGCAGVFVVEIHRLPLEGAELVERLHLDPLDVLHRGDESGDSIDVRRIIRETGHQGEPHPSPLAGGGEPLGEPQG